MNKIFVIAFSLITIASFGQKKQKVDLDWKIDKGEKLSYLTVMSEIDTSSIDVNFGGLFKSFTDSTNKGVSEAAKFFKKLNEAVSKVDLVATLSNSRNGIVDIVVIANQSKDKTLQVDTTDTKQKDFIKMMQSMNQGVMLRGSVYETGEIHSFWLKSNQKNIIALLFQLPTKPVQIGDIWEVDVNLISNDQNFECDSAYRRNVVKLVDLKKVNGDNIAVVKYDIVEYVKGNFTMPSFSGKGGDKTATMMKFTHQAIAEFSLSKGRWISYDGIMTLVASGVMTANKKTKFTLIKV